MSAAVVKYDVVAHVEETTIAVMVRPNARENGVMCLRNGVLYVRIAAPAVDGKANQELVRVLSGLLGVSKSNFAIERGITSRTKIVVIGGMTRAQVMERLERLGVKEEISQ